MQKIRRKRLKENEFMIELLAELEKSKSKSKINKNIKEIEKAVNALRLTAILAKGDSKKALNQYIKQLEGQLNQIKLKAKIDQRNLKSEINGILNNLSFKDIELGVNENKTKLKVQKVVADAKKVVQNNPISVNIELKKDKLDNQLTTYLSKHSKIRESEVLLKEADKIRQKISAINDKNSLRDATDSFQLFKSEVSATGFATRGTTEKIGSLVKGITKVGSVFGVASMAINKYQQSLKTLKENDTILTEISKASNSTKQQLNDLGNSSFKTASKYGQISSDYLLAVQEMNRSGFYNEKGQALGELTLKTEAAGNVTAETAQKYLLATSAAYDYAGSIEKLTAVLDGQNLITNRNSVDMETMATATEKAGSVAANAGIKINELSAMIGTISARTKEAGEKTGTGIKSLIVNLQNISSDKIVNTLKKANASMTETINGVEKLRNPIEILKDLAKTYNSLDEKDPLKSEITTNIGQKFHANQLSALLSGWKDYEKMLNDYSEGTGSSDIEAQKTADSWEGRLNALQNSWDSLVNSLTDANSVKGGISFFNGLIQGTEKLVDTFDAIPIAITAIQTSLTALNKDYGITQIRNAETGKLDIQGNLFGIDFTQIKQQKKHFAEAEEAIAGWNQKLSNGVTDVDSFNNKVVKNNAQLKAYLQTCSSDAPASLSGYKSYLNAAGISTDALRLKTVLLNSAIGMGIGLAIQGAISGISYLITYEEKQAEAFENAKTATEECAKAIKDIKSEMSDTVSKASELSSEFAKLVQGVNPMTNKNENLSTESYERFLDVNNQLAELFPSLTKNYDENGNAILGLSGDVDTVTASIARLVEQQNNLAKADMRDKLDEYVNGNENSDGVFKALEGYKNDVEDAEKELNSLKDTYDSIVNKKGSKVLLGNEYNKYLDEIKNKFGKEAYDLIYNATEQQYQDKGDTWYAIDFSKLELDETTKGKITESYNTFYQDLQTNLSVKTSELEAKNQEMSNMMMLWVEDLDLYKNSSNESFKRAIESMVGSIQWSDLDVEDGNIDEAKQLLQSLILTPLTTACNNPDTKLQVVNALNKLFSIDFSKLSYKDANKQIQGFLTIIMNALNAGLPDDKKKSLLDMYKMFGLGDYDKATVKMKNSLTGIAKEGTSDYQKLADYTKDFTKEQTEAWLSATNGALNAEDAINKFENSLNSSADNIKSFKEAWDSIGTEGADKEKKAAQEAKDELLKLAEAGKLTVEAFENSSIAEQFLKDTGLSAEEATKKVNKLVSSIDQLSSMKSGISSISSILGEKKENLSNKKTKNNGIGADTLASMPDDVKAQTDEYERFVEVMGNGKSSMEQCQKAANALATAYVNSSNFLSNLTTKNKDYYISVLEEMNVENASEVVKNALTKQTYALRLAKLVNANATKEEIAALQEEATQYGITSTALANYVLQEKIANNNALDTSRSIKSLIRLAEQCGATSKVIVVLRDLLKETSTLENIKSDSLANYTASIKTDAQHAVDEAFNAKGEAVGKQQNKIDKLNKKLQKMLKKGATALKVDVAPTPSTSGKTKDKSSKDKTKTKQVIDWIERRLKNLQNTIDYTSSKLQNLFTVNAKNNNLDKQIKTTTKLINEYGIAAEKYQQKANQVAKASTKTVKGKNGKKKNVAIQGLSNDVISKIKTGKLTKKTKLSSLIKEYGEDAANKIQSYIDYYDKAQDAKKNKQDQIAKRRELQIQKNQNYVDDYNAKATLAETKAGNAVGYKKQNSYIATQLSYLNKSYQKQIAIAKLNKDTTEQARLQAEYEAKKVELQKQQIENLKTEYENKINLIGNDEQNVNNTLSQMEARGQIIKSSYYSSLNKYENQKLSKLNSELKDLQGKQNTFTKYSQEWYDLQSDIQSVKNAINDAKVAIIENNKKVGELRQAMYDEIAERNSNVSTEANFLAGLLGDNLTDDKTGGLTKEGLAMLGTYGIDMEANSNTAQTRKAEREELEKLIASYKKGDSHALDVYGSLEAAEKKLSEIIQKQQEAISAEYANEKQIYDLMTQRYEAKLSYIQSIIEAIKKELDLEKDLYSYQRNISNQTKNIATLEKQLASLQGDTSEEGRAKLQKIQVSLDEANQELQDTEYERYISDQQDMLDNMYSQYEDLLQELEKDFEKVVQDGVKTINGTSKEISTTLSTYSSKYGYNPSKDMKSILNGLNVTTLPNSLSDGLSDLGVIFQKSAQDIIAAYTGNTKPTTESKPKTNTSVAKENGVNNSKTSSDYGYGATPQSYISNTGNSVVNASTYDKVASGVSDQGKKNAKVYDALNDLAFGFGTSKYWSDNEKNKTPSSKVNQWIQKQKTYSKSYNSKGDVVYRYLNETGLKALAKKLGVKYGEDSKYKTKEIAAYFKSAGIPGFQTGGVVRSNAPKTGDNVWVRVNPDETILTKKFTDILPYSLNVMNDFTKSVTLPDYSNIKTVNPNVGNNKTFGDINVTLDNVTLELPNVSDYRSFRDEMKNDVKSVRMYEAMHKECSLNGKVGNIINLY